MQKSPLQGLDPIKNGEPEKVSELYLDDGLQFWGTMAKDLATNKENAIAYFRHFLSGKENLDIEITSQEIRAYEKTGLISGLYNFHFNHNGTRQTVKARYSFIFEEINGNILIANHHSSQIPNNG